MRGDRLVIFCKSGLGGILACLSGLDTWEYGGFGGLRGEYPGAYA